MIQTLDSRAIPAAGWMNVRLSVYQKLLLKITKRLLDSDCKLRLKIMKISIRQISGSWIERFEVQIFNKNYLISLKKLSDFQNINWRSKKAKLSSNKTFREAWIAHFAGCNTSGHCNFTTVASSLKRVTFRRFRFQNCSYYESVRSITRLL